MISVSRLKDDFKSCPALRQSAPTIQKRCCGRRGEHARHFRLRLQISKHPHSINKAERPQQDIGHVRVQRGSQKRMASGERGHNLQRPSGTSTRLLSAPNSIANWSPIQNSVLGRNKDDQRKTDHVARPLNSLQDPDSFAPPPRRTGTGLEPAPAASTEKRKVIAAPSRYQDPRSSEKVSPVKISHESQLHEQEQQLVVHDDKPKAYNMNTTGLRTDHLPPPPGRRDGADGRSADAAPAAVPIGRAAKTQAKPAPGLPPRLPARGPVPAPPPREDPAQLNQGAVDRLGSAGVSVPGFGIGSNKGQMNELQNKFSKLNTKPGTSTGDAVPAQGTTWAEKRAALDTASKFQKDPSSISFSDAKAAASTANNFRQRHGEQVAAGLKTANQVNQKYGVADKVGGFANKVQPSQDGQDQKPQGQGAALLNAAAGLGKKKPPPPPPPKKASLAGNKTDAEVDDAPPPVPMSTRPNF